VAFSSVLDMSYRRGADCLQVHYNWMFYVGIAPVFIAFLAVTMLSHYDNYDPVLLILKKAFHCSTWCVLLTRRRYFTR